MKVILNAVEGGTVYEPIRKTYIKNLDSAPMVGNYIKLEHNHSIKSYIVKSVSYNIKGSLEVSIELIHSTQKED